MMTVRFLSDYDYKPHALLTIAYEAGMVVEVEDDCASGAIEAGAAEEFSEPGAE